MEQKVYTVEGRQFRTESDIARAKHDKQIIDRLRAGTDFKNKKELEALCMQLRSGKYKFLTLLGEDFLEEVEGLTRKDSGTKGRTARKVIRDDPPKPTGQKKASGSTKTARPPERAASAKPSGQPGRAGQGKEVSASGRAGQGKEVSASGRAGQGKGVLASGPPGGDKVLDAAVEEVLLRRERLRKLIVRISSVVAIICLGYFGVYSFYNYRTESAYREMNERKGGDGAAIAVPSASEGPLYTLDDTPAVKEVLEEYKKLLITNKRLIGWIKIDDTNINYPVMQTENNEYYLDHNANEEHDINGAIFMDKDCDVIKPSTNYILYGHHMKNGKMFGKLDSYQNESYYKEHPYISFDTIYEKGTYQVMYVFRSRVYKETEIVFKYYQFIDANSEQEFESNMQEMAAMSLYDTGVTAEYGDQLLTLSTCDYQETDGRFVVVAKKIAKE